MKRIHFITVLLAALFFTITLAAPHRAPAASGAEISRDAQQALQKLYNTSSGARAIGEKAVSVLVFPGIVKGGFIVGGLYGEGALIKNGYTVAYYNTVAASYGLQAGLQKYGYALFFMTDGADGYLNRSDGWELGIGPNITVIDVGAAKNLSTTTMKSDIYAFFFDQKGLMGGLGIQGTKVTKISK
ncbi:MAG TPA: twin-arginine translocation pathway signal protein [Deltaproteobacteria bacterium]|nr:twin-arginine translocation pathway signal protein [Deltaproteobacteria bacterium]